MRNSRILLSSALTCAILGVPSAPPNASEIPRHYLPLPVAEIV